MKNFAMYVTSVLVLGSIAMSGCVSGTPPEVEFVLPNGYTTQQFELVLDTQSDSDWDETATGFRILVPNSGELKVRSLAPLLSRHRQRMRW